MCTTRQTAKHGRRPLRQMHIITHASYRPRKLGAQLSGSNLKCPAAALSKHTHARETINNMTISRKR